MQELLIMFPRAHGTWPCTLKVRPTKEFLFSPCFIFSMAGRTTNKKVDALNVKFWNSIRSPLLCKLNSVFILFLWIPWNIRWPTPTKILLLGEAHELISLYNYKNLGKITRKLSMADCWASFVWFFCPRFGSGMGLISWCCGYQEEVDEHKE